MTSQTATAAPTATRTATPNPDVADVAMAGRLYPMRDFRVRLTHKVASELLEERRIWWIDVAIGYADLAEKALDHGDVPGAREALDDHRTAMQAAAYYGRKSIGR